MLLEKDIASLRDKVIEVLNVLLQEYGAYVCNDELRMNSRVRSSCSTGPSAPSPLVLAKRQTHGSCARMTMVTTA